MSEDAKQVAKLLQQVRPLIAVLPILEKFLNDEAAVPGMEQKIKGLAESEAQLRSKVQARKDELAALASATSATQVSELAKHAEKVSAAQAKVSEAQASANSIISAANAKAKEIITVGSVEAQRLVDVAKSEVASLQSKKAEVQSDLTALKGEIEEGKKALLDIDSRINAFRKPAAASR